MIIFNKDKIMKTAAGVVGIIGAFLGFFAALERF